MPSLEYRTRRFSALRSPYSPIILLLRSPNIPYFHSTSVTKALADLWPGQMAVIPFSGGTTQLPILGPHSLSDPTL